MNFPQLMRVRYQIRFETRWIAYSSFFAGLGVFLLCVFFFGIKNMGEMDGGYLAVSFWMPLLILTAHGILLRGIRAQNPVPYGAVGVLYCVFMIIFSCIGGSQNPVLAVVWYILTAGVLGAVILGIFRGRILVLVMFLLPVVCKLCITDWTSVLQGNPWKLLLDLSVFCGLLAFSTFGLCMNPVMESKKRRKINT